MFGDLLGDVIEVVTLPLDAANAAVDIATGGDGSKASRNDRNSPNPIALGEQLRDAVVDTARNIGK